MSRPVPQPPHPDSPLSVVPGRIPLPPTTLVAGPFLLRRIGPGDEALERALSRCEDVVTWTYYPPDLPPVQARQRILRAQGRAAEGLSARYVVELDSQPLGTAGIKNADDAPEIFYALLPSGRGQGAATAAATVLSGWALDAGAPYAALWTLAGNTASERVARRAGFTCAKDDSADDDSAAGRRADADVPGGDGTDAGYADAAEILAGPRLWTRFTD